MTTHPRDLMLVAASGLAAEVAEAARRAGWAVVGVADDDPATHGRLVAGARVLGGLEVVVPGGPRVVLCAGRGSVRQSLAARLRRPDDGYATVVDPSVWVPESCSVGAGSVILAGSVLTADVKVGRHVVLMPGVVLTHDVVVDDGATLCAGVVLGGGARVRERAYLGMASSVRERTEVGADGVLGMGSVLLSSLPAGETWVGVPSRPMRSWVVPR